MTETLRNLPGSTNTQAVVRSAPIVPGGRSSASNDGEDVPRAGWVLSTYFAEGLPYSVVHQLPSQLFTAANASLQSIGLTSLYNLAWNAKFAWSPLIDMIGTTRRWIIGLEFALLIAISALAWPAQQQHLHTVAVLLVAVAVIAATHDIAIDGFYLRALDTRSQSSMSGLRVAAYRVAMLAGNGVLVWIAGKVSWFACFALAALMMGLLAVLHWLVLPRPPEHLVQTPRPSLVPALKTFLNAFLSFFRQPHTGAAVALILVYRLGDAMLFSMSTPLLRDLGLSTSARGLVSGMGGTVAGIAGAMAAAAWITKKGLTKTLFPIAVVQASALPIYVLLAWGHPRFGLIVLGVLCEHLAAGVGTAGFSVFLMRRCRPEYKAAHFAIATAMMSVAATVSGSASGFIASALGFVPFFMIASAAAIPSILLARSLAPKIALTSAE